MFFLLFTTVDVFSSVVVAVVAGGLAAGPAPAFAAPPAEAGAVGIAAVAGPSVVAVVAFAEPSAAGAVAAAAAVEPSAAGVAVVAVRQPAAASFAVFGSPAVDAVLAGPDVVAVAEPPVAADAVFDSPVASAVLAELGAAGLEPVAGPEVAPPAPEAAAVFFACHPGVFWLLEAVARDASVPDWGRL